MPEGKSEMARIPQTVNCELELKSLIPLGHASRNKGHHLRSLYEDSVWSCKIRVAILHELSSLSNKMEEILCPMILINMVVKPILKWR